MMIEQTRSSGSPAPLATTAADICRRSTEDLDCLQRGGRCRLVDLDAVRSALIAR